MVRIHRDADDRGRYVLCSTRGADAAARGHDETPREARAPRGLPAIPSEGRGRAGRPPDRRPHLRGIGRARPERRMGDAQEGPGRDEASQPRRTILEHLGGLADIRTDCRGPRAGLDEGASSALGVPPWTGVGRRTGRPLEERLWRNADRRERGRHARGNRGRVERGPGYRADGHMFLGDLGMIAEIALFEGADGLHVRGLRLLAPMKPMLAEMAEDLDEVLAVHGGMTAIEYKLDGARIQIHRKGDAVKIFSRRLSDVTSSLPELVAIAKSLPAPEFLLEGEVVAVDREGKPLPFQDLMRRFRRVHGIESAQEEIPLKLYLFDVLHLDGRTLIDEPYRVRWEILERLVPPDLLTARRIAQRKEEIEAFLHEALIAGHEGLMAKQLESTYSVGKRGKKWFKIKPADHLDLAITAAEWGSGRREGWLSNYWLAVRDDKSAAFQMIGKTFKGLTDEEFKAMTERLRGLATSEERWGFHVRPETVVEVAYNEIQRSPHYPSGFALRFARIVRIREDKGPKDVDTYERLKDLYAKQFERKGRGPDDL